MGFRSIREDVIPLFRLGLEFHTKSATGIGDHGQPRIFLSFILCDFADRAGSLQRQRQHLRPLGQVVQHLIQVIHKFVDFLVRKSMTQTSFTQSFVFAPCTREAMQPVLTEHGFCFGDQRDDLLDGHLPVNMVRFLCHRGVKSLHYIATILPVNSRVFLRLAAGVLLLLLGWQLGVMHERGGRSVRIGGSTDGLVTPGASASGITVNNPRRDVDVSLLWDVWDELNDHYIDPQKLQVTPLVYGAAEGLTRAIGDPYTVFMTPKENTEFRDGLSGNLEGIGAELTVRDGAVIIVSPIKGSPAARAGLLSKDIITEVDGESAAGWSLSQVVSRIRGPKGTTVRIGIYREGKGELDFTITRAEIHVPSVEAHLITADGKTIGYAALNQFGENSIAELKKELQGFKDKKVDGLILDLRNNGGGYLDGAVELVSVFVSQGTVVRVERRNQSTDTQNVSGRTLLPDMPLVVLQNEATASASEIVAGALQDHGRAKIVGEKSFGKGTVQEVVDLPGGSSLRVTIARWLTPNGKNLGKEGVHPDILVKPKEPSETPPPVDAPWDWKTDPQLSAGVGVLVGKATR